MADAQVLWSVGALGGAVTDPAWRAKPNANGRGRLRAQNAL
jgi:hypothetical protein